MKVYKTIKILCRPILFLIIIFKLLSCSFTDHSSNFDLTKNHTVSVFDIFSDVRVLKLESVENNLIGQIGRVRYYESRYYILDNLKQQIFCFDENGRYVYNIDSQGRGKGEYHNVTDFAIDENNKQLVLLDPVMQRVHFFDLNGSFLSSHDIQSEKVLGLNRVYPMKDSILLLISVTYDNLQFYSLKEEEIVYADFTYDVPSTLHVFSPKDNVFFFDDKVLFSVPLSRDIVNVSALVPETYFTWCFGPQNNSDQQLNRLIEEINFKQENQESYLLPFQAVGKNKILNHHIIKSFENERFRIAVVEFDNRFKFVVIDKTDNNHFVFDAFEEGFLLPFEFMQSGRAIIFHIPEFELKEIKQIKNAEIQEYFLERNLRLYSPEILNEDCRKIVENHDPMTDNPFLVVYKFKE